MTSRGSTYCAVGVLTALVGVPLLALSWLGVVPPPVAFGEAPTLTGVLTEPGIATLAGRTLTLGLLTAVVSTSAGAWLAWAQVRWRTPLDRYWPAAVALAMAPPSYLIGATLTYSTGLRGLPAAVWVLSVVATPLATLTIAQALRGIGTNEEEAARTLGEPPMGILRHVVWPRLRPALGQATVLSILYAVSDFGAVAVTDSPALTWRLFDAVRAQELTRAVGLALVLVATTVPLVLLADRLRGGVLRVQVSQARAARRRDATPAESVITLLIALSVVAPGLLWPAWVMTRWVWTGATAGGPWTGVAGPLADAALIAAGAATVITVLANVPAQVTATDHLSAPLLRRGVETTGALPGVLLAFGWLGCTLAVSRLLPAGAYAMALGSGLPLLGALASRYLVDAHAPLDAAWRQVDPRWEDAATTLGATRAQRWTQLRWPALRGGVATAWLFVFVAVTKDLPITLILAGPTGLRPLASRLWDRYNEALLADAGAAGLILLALSLAGVLLSWRLHAR